MLGEGKKELARDAQVVSWSCFSGRGSVELDGDCVELSYGHIDKEHRPPWDVCLRWRWVRIFGIRNGKVTKAALLPGVDTRNQWGIVEVTWYWPDSQVFRKQVRSEKDIEEIWPEGFKAKLRQRLEG